MKETAREMQNETSFSTDGSRAPASVKKTKKWVRILPLLLAFLFLFLVLRPIRRVQMWLYPLRYTEEINAACDTFHVPRARVYAVIKTESNFDPQARSHKGAVGLMQLMPQTYTWICELQGILPEEQVPTDPQKNIFAGVFYLSRLYERYQNWDTVSAAYNAGSGNVSLWLENEDYTENGVLTQIPFAETEKYVKKVRRAEQMYLRLYAQDVTGSS